MHIAEEAGYDFGLLRGVIDVNDAQFERVADKVERIVGGSLQGCTVAVWGLTFKARTDDLRDSPSLAVIERLVARGARSGPTTPRCKALPPGGADGIEVCADPYAACDDAGGARGAHRVGRLPLARLRQGGRRADRAAHRRRPQPARPGEAAAARVRLRRGRPVRPSDRRRDGTARRSSSPAAPGSSARTCAAGSSSAGDEVIAIDNLITGSLDNVAELSADDRVHVHRPRREQPHRGRRARSTPSCTSPVPASPRDYLEHPIKTLKVGSLGTHNTLGLAKDKGARYFLASTSEVYGDPLEHPQKETYWGHVNPIGPRGVYDEAKRFAEAMTMAYHRAHGVDVRIVRIFNTYGPRMRPLDGRVVSNFIVQALAGKPLTVYGDGSQTRSFCYVDDEVRGLLALLDSDYVGPVNIGNPDEFTVLELARDRARGDGLVVGDRVRAAAGRRSRRSAVPTSPSPARCSAGSRRSTSAPVWPARPSGSPVPEYRSLSVVVPVFNERNTVVEILRRMRQVELPVDLEIVVVDDGSDDGTEKVLGALEDSTVRVVHHPQQPGQGRGHPHRARARPRRPPADPGRRPRVRPRRLAAAADARAEGQGAGGLRQPLHRRAQQPALLALGGQPVPLAGHQRALQHDALRHGDLLQALRPAGARRHHHRVRPLRVRARDHRQGAASGLPHLRGADLLRRSRTSTRARRSPGRTASAALATLVRYRFSRRVD